MNDANTEPAVMKSISDALGMAPLILQQAHIVEEQEDKLPAPLEVEPSKEDQEAEEDFAIVRENQKELIEKGKEALDGILRIASGSEHPRAFEVASNLIKTMSDLNSNLLELHEKRRQLVPVPEPEKTPTSITNNNNTVFVGTTQEMLDYIDEQEARREAERNVIEHEPRTK